MEALKADTIKDVVRDSLVTCADNTGTHELEIISVADYSGTKSRHPEMGTGDKVTVSVTEGAPKMCRQVPETVIVRQRKSIRRFDGTRVKFEGNTAITIDEMEGPRGTEVRGPVAREVVKRLGSIASTTTMIV